MPELGKQARMIDVGFRYWPVGTACCAAAL